MESLLEAGKILCPIIVDTKYLAVWKFRIHSYHENHVVERMDLESKDECNDNSVNSETAKTAELVS